MNENKTFTFNFNLENIKQLRNENEINYERISTLVIYDKKSSKKVDCWNQVCTAFVRIQETFEYVNTLVLGKSNCTVQAFDLYEFLMHCDVIIKSIERLGVLFDVKGVEKVKKSTNCFGRAIYYDESHEDYIEIKTKGTDSQFWNYLRSLSTIHPLETTQSNFIDNENENFLHTSPYAMWTKYCGILMYKKTKDIYVNIWKGSNDSSASALFFNIEMMINYINCWNKLLIDIKNSIVIYNTNEKERLKKEPIKSIEDFSNDWGAYIKNIKAEYQKRYNKNCRDTSFEDAFTNYFIKCLNTHFVDLKMQDIFDEYKNLLKKEILTYQEHLQNMTLQDEEPISDCPDDFNCFKLTKEHDFHYEFEKLSYLADTTTQDPNCEDNGLEEQSKLKSPSSKEENSQWGRGQAKKIYDDFLKTHIKIDFNLNDWKVYLQIVLGFFYLNKQCQKL